MDAILSAPRSRFLSPERQASPERRALPERDASRERKALPEREAVSQRRAPDAPRPEPQAGGARLTLSEVEKRFGDKRVVAGLDLDIAPGEFTAIVGRSGCGKSTLLRLLLDLERADSGAVERRGADGSAAPTTRLMFQEPRLLPWQSILRNVALGVPRDVPALEREARAQEALAAVGLAGRGGEWPSVLSGGQRQRVALARALVSRPGFLALDEPLGALDALTRIEMQSLLETVWQAEGFTAVLVTHDVSEAVRLADRVVLMEAGRIAYEERIALPRPRRHGDPEAARIESRILDRLLREPA
ncbi:ABC transporter ATP-binding protein [Aureimonas ureilytica]|uniref:ABC transporter ATP-binding protein n=1 Tax=Aureimonas ureilytica TaxID=401562 RepID=UPI003CF0E343